MKVYHLTIVYDETTEEIEYIEESVEVEGGDERTFIELTKEDIERTTTLDVIQRLKDIAEA